MKKKAKDNGFYHLYYEEDLELMKNTIAAKFEYSNFNMKYDYIRTSLIRSYFGFDHIVGDITNFKNGGIFETKYYYKNNFIALKIIAPIIANKDFYVKQVMKEYKNPLGCLRFLF